MTPELIGFYTEIFLAQEDFRLKTGELAEYSGNCKTDIFPVLIPDDIVIDDHIKARLLKLVEKLTEIISCTNTGMDFSLFTGKFSDDADRSFVYTDIVFTISPV